MTAALRPDWYLRGLRLRHLRLLTVLGDVNNVGEAARRMATTQPAVSKMLAELEALVGVSLFTRTSKGTYPTQHGASMIRHARWVLGDLDRLGQEWGEQGASSVERIVIGINSSSSAFLVPDALLRLELRALPVTVVVREASIEALLPDLFTRKLDLVIARLGAATQHIDLLQQVLFEEPMCVVAALDHPLGEIGECSWQALASHPWILPPQGSPVRAGLDMLFLREGVQPRASVESASVLNNLVLMDGSRALSLLPRAVARFHAKRHGLRILPVFLPQVFGPLGVVRHESLQLSTAMQTLIACLKETVAAMALADTDA